MSTPIERMARAMAEWEYRAIVGREEFSWEEDTTRFQKERYRALAIAALRAMEADGD